MNPRAEDQDETCGPMRPHRALPGPMIDLATEGPRTVTNRGDIVRAIRSVMLSAHHNGWSWAQTHALLTDIERRRLAHLFAHGKGGRRIAPRRRDQLLREMWDDTARVAAANPPPSADDIADFIECAREQLDRAELSDAHRAIIAIALDLADEIGTVRPALPCRAISERLARRGIRVSHMDVWRALGKICEKGEWLTLAIHGNSATRRANLYRVAPALLLTARLNSLSNTPNLSNTNLSNKIAEEPQVDRTAGTLITNLTAAEHAVVLAALANYRCGIVATPADPAPPHDARPEPHSGVADVIPMRRSA